MGEAKKHHKSRFIDRCLARKPEQLTAEERAFVQAWHLEDDHTKHIYQALNHMRYVLKATTSTQAKKRLKDWLKRKRQIAPTCFPEGAIVMLSM